MYVTSSEIYAARMGRNYSRAERELNAYLALEYRFQAVGAASARRFLIGGMEKSSSRTYAQLREWSIRAGAFIPTMLVHLHLMRPHRAGE